MGAVQRLFPMNPADTATHIAVPSATPRVHVPEHGILGLQSTSYMRTLGFEFITNNKVHGPLGQYHTSTVTAHHESMSVDWKGVELGWADWTALQCRSFSKECYRILCFYPSWS